MAYCSQFPWLPNTNIGEVICQTTEIDNAWYLAVIRACVLEHDIARLPLGDSSLVGNRGLTLSGGQKQRIVSVKAWLVIANESGTCSSIIRPSGYHLAR